MARQPLTLTALARAGFVELSRAREDLASLDEFLQEPIEFWLEAFEQCADSDAALSRLLMLLREDSVAVSALLSEPVTMLRTLRLLGASSGVAEFFLRHPDQLDILQWPPSALLSNAELQDDLVNCVAAVSAEDAWVKLRIRYRRRLMQIIVFDLEQPDSVFALDLVASALADLAAAALEASLSVARRDISGDGVGQFPPEEVEATQLAIIGMGKAGARELNYVSDVDVIFVVSQDESSGIENSRAVDIGTRLALYTMRGMDAPAMEPELWEVDANLRPEGKAGALVRTLESHLAYYERWAKSWEFQALLKARPLAGDIDLGERYVEAIWPFVWESSLRQNFVESVQKMRERVTENIPDDEVDHQIKLGPGGLRDIEFTVQLLQLVHGVDDAAVRAAGTLPALAALAAQGYIGRSQAAEFAEDYRILRVLEHRLQLVEMRRTHLMPRDEAELRVLARGTGLAADAKKLVERWNGVKRRVRGLHERLFYRPLLAAVAALPTEERALTSGEAKARLAATGFLNPAGALSHIAALTSGVSRRAAIQRHLLPVMLQWFADGADPDYGLLTFRRLSEGLGSTHWFLRMLRDSGGAAKRLTRILSGSKYAGELLGGIPESVAWLDSDADLRPRSPQVLRDEMRAVLKRHRNVDAAAAALRGIRRREVLRTAFSAVLGLNSVRELAGALTETTDIFLEGMIDAIRRDLGVTFEFALIGMGRYGGKELGFGSDTDILYVFRTQEENTEDASAKAKRVVQELVRLTSDATLPLDLDNDLRPEGKSGSSVRSLRSYRAYYERWSLTWEAQALLRARGVAGDESLLKDFETLADEVRYPRSISDHEVREVKRIKARVEGERLPQAADPSRHVKLGRGSLSDVEWYVQLQQLKHGAEHPQLRTTSTLDALDASVKARFIDEEDAELLRAAWIFASRLRSAMTLWLNKTTDVLPADRRQLEGIARLMEYPPGSATQLEEDYLAVTRRARAVFERGFYGVDPGRPSM